MKCFTGFLVTLKCLTLNDLEMPFYADFIVSLPSFFCLAFGENYVKKNEDTPIQSATKMFVKHSSFWHL